MNHVELQAQEYAERVFNELSLRTIKGVEPRIASNCHRLGYIRGAEDIIVEKEEEIFFLERKLRKWHYIAYDLVGVIAVMGVAMILICL